MDVTSSDIQKLHQQVTAIVQVNPSIHAFIKLHILVNTIYGYGIGGNQSNISFVFLWRSHWDAV